MGRPPTTRRSGSSGRCWRTSFTVHAIDRRGRGASGDAAGRIRSSANSRMSPPSPRRWRPLAGEPVDVFGHSYGGRCALGAALLTDAIRRVISYEGAPTPPGSSYHPTGIEDRLRERLAAGDRDGALATVPDRGRRHAGAPISRPTRPTRSGRPARPPPARSCASSRPKRTRPPRSTGWAPSASRSSNSSAARACPSSATLRSRSTSGWLTAASSSSTAPATPPTTRIPTRWSPPSRRSWPERAAARRRARLSPCLR